MNYDVIASERSVRAKQSPGEWRLLRPKNGLAMTAIWQVQVAQVRGLQEETQKELDALMPSILDKAFKGEL